MDEEMENTVLDDPGDDISSVVDPVPVDTPAPEVTETPEPETSAQPMEVVSVEDLLDRLTTAIEEGATGEAAAAEEEPDEVIPEEETGPSAADTAVELLEVIQQQTAPHPLLTTDFADYTVTEGLLLLALLAGFVSACFKMLKEGFSWL